MDFEKTTVVGREEIRLFFQNWCVGCPTCECAEEPKQQEVQCEQTICDLNCKYGYQRDERGCEQCVCNSCPLTSCRMFCKYGFRRNQDGCEVCDCDWSPVAENIQCDEVWV